MRNRRAVLGTMIGLPLVAAAAGCGATPSAQPESPKSPGSSVGSDGLPVAEGKTQYPLQLKTWASDTVLTKRPSRIAVVGRNAAYDAVSALGITPVFADAGNNYAWWNAEERAKIEVTDPDSEAGGIKPELVASARPDVIISVGWAKENIMKQLATIAPVVDFAEPPDNLNRQWEDTQRLVGKALDLTDLTETTIQGVYDKVAAIAKANPQFAGKTAAMATDYGTKYGVQYLMPAGGPTERIFLGLGFKANPLAKNFSKDVQVSEERLDLLDGDVLLMSYFGNDQEVRKKRESGTMFKNLRPVREGRFVSVDSTKPKGAGWALRAGASAISLPYISDVLANDWLADIKFD